MKVVITSMRNEAHYIDEWVAWNIYIGFDKVIVFTNNNTDATLEVLEKHRKKGVVEYFELNPPPGSKPQMYAFKQGLEWARKHQPDWIACMDPDEFLVLKQDKNIDEFLNRYPQTDAIAINWKIFGSADIPFKGKGLTVERFLMAAKQDFHHHRQFKSLFRYSEHIERFHHRAIYKEAARKSIRYIYADGVAFTPEEMLPGFAKDKRSHVNFDLAQINHYTIRSLQEFDIKMNRGNGLHAVGVNENASTYLKAFDRSEVYETDVLKHMEGYLAVYDRLTSANQDSESKT